MGTDPSFHMVVEDVFNIAGRGTVVTGSITAGTVRKGDEVLIRRSTSDKRRIVAGIESFRKTIDQASAGDKVGILLKDVRKDEVHRGDEWVSPDRGSS